MATLLIAEHEDKALSGATHKTVTAAKALGGDIHVLVAGQDCKPAAEAAAKIDGVKKVLVADDAKYAHRLAEPMAALIVSLAKDYDAIVVPATSTTSSTAAVVLLNRAAMLISALKPPPTVPPVPAEALPEKVPATPPPVPPTTRKAP